jgi:hypothetical protein
LFSFAWNPYNSFVRFLSNKTTRCYVTRTTFDEVGQPQGCQMVYFQTKNPNSDKFWWALDCKLLIYFTAIWNTLRTLGIFYDHLVQFVFIWYISSGFGVIRQ